MTIFIEYIGVSMTSRTQWMPDLTVYSIRARTVAAASRRVQRSDALNHTKHRVESVECGGVYTLLFWHYISVRSLLNKEGVDTAELER